MEQATLVENDLIVQCNLLFLLGILIFETMKISEQLPFTRIISGHMTLPLQDVQRFMLSLNALLAYLKGKNKGKYFHCSNVDE